MKREELKAKALIDLGSEPAPKEWENIPCIKEQMPSLMGGEVSLQRFTSTDICAWLVGIGGLWQPQSDYFRVSLPPAEGAEASRQIRQLKEFHTAFKLPQRDIPTIIPPDEFKLRHKILVEEVGELSDAYFVGDIVEVADAITDCLYVLIGTALQFGIADKLEACFDEVHRSNMSKLGNDGKPIMREDGKVMKGENYIRPDLKSILSELIAVQPQPTAEGAEEIDALIKQIDKNVEKPMVTAQFGDMWKSHAIEHYGFPELVNMAWRQGRRAILLERELRSNFASLQNNPHPTAECAEQILDKLAGEFMTTKGDYSDNIRIQFCHEREFIIHAMQEFATIHAKKIADKIVSERLREELIAYDKFLSNTYWGVGHIVKRDEAVDEYLKSREK